MYTTVILKSDIFLKVNIEISQLILNILQHNANLPIERT